MDLLTLLTAAVTGLLLVYLFAALGAAGVVLAVGWVEFARPTRIVRRACGRSSPRGSRKLTHPA